MNHAITSSVNGGNSFICLWCNTTIVAIGRKMVSTIRYPLWRNKGAVRLRLRDFTRSSGSLIPVLPLLILHDVRCDFLGWISDVWCFGDKSDVDWVVVFFFTFPLVLGRKYVRFMIFRFLSSISHPNVCLVVVSNWSSLRFAETNILRKLFKEFSIYWRYFALFRIKVGNRALLGLLIEAFTLYETAA